MTFIDDPVEPSRAAEERQQGFVEVPCVECGVPVRLTNRPTLYCSDLCRQTLKLVHWARKAINEETLNLPDMQEAFQMKVAHILAGGYSDRARRLPAEVRQAVFQRSGGWCQLCGMPADQIDHIAGDSSNLANLRALCRDCNMAEAQKRFVPVGRKHRGEADRILDRVFAPTPLNERDDESKWSEAYRRLQSERRDLLVAAGIIGRSHQRSAGVAEPTVAMIVGQITSWLSDGKTLEEACALVFDDSSLTRRERLERRKVIKAAIDAVSGPPYAVEPPL